MTTPITEAQNRFQKGEHTLRDLQVLLQHYRQEKNYTEMRKVRAAGKHGQLQQAVIDKGDPVRIQVVATSDDEKDEFRKLAWGDYWLQHELIWALGQCGFTVSRETPHITLHLFGFPRQIPQNTYNILWCTSHPELLSFEVAFQYDGLFSLGRKHAEYLTRHLNIEADYLPAASSLAPYPDTTQQYPAVFIGNTKPKQGMRPCVKRLQETGYPFLVWGWGWEEHLPSETIAGQYFDYKQINRLYAQSFCVLNDHHTAMQEFGMVSPKNFDICSSGGLLICERNMGIEAIFGQAVPQFSNSEELKQILNEFTHNPEKREARRREAMQISQTYTFERVAQAIFAHVHRP